MTNETEFQGIRLAYVHFSVTTPREPVERTACAAATLSIRGHDERSQVTADHSELAA